MANTLKNIPVHNGSKFQWTGRRGSALISDFNSPVVGRLYADSYDVGFYVLSPRTGRKIMFSQISQSVEDEEVSRGFESVDDDEGFTVTIYND